MAVLVVLLKILKVIGFILLGILGFILFIFLLVMIAPIHYRAEGLSEEDMSLAVRVTYLARFFKVLVTYDKGGGLSFKGTVLWGAMTLFPREPDFTKDFVPKEDKAPSKKEGPLEDEGSAADESYPAEDALSGDAASGKAGEISKDDIPDDDIGGASEEKEKKSPGAVIDKIKSIREKWLTEGNRRAFSHVMKQLVFMLKKYAPRRARGHLMFSTGDPATTGELIGAMSLMPFMYSKHFSVTPDFETESFYIKGIMTVKGFIQPGVILVALVRMILNRDTRRLIKTIISG